MKYIENPASKHLVGLQLFIHLDIYIIRFAHAYCSRWFWQWHIIEPADMISLIYIYSASDTIYCSTPLTLFILYTASPLPLFPPPFVLFYFSSMLLQLVFLWISIVLLWHILLLILPIWLLQRYSSSIFCSDISVYAPPIALFMLLRQLCLCSSYSSVLL